METGAPGDVGEEPSERMETLEKESTGSFKSSSGGEGPSERLTPGLSGVTDRVLAGVPPSPTDKRVDSGRRSAREKSVPTGPTLLSLREVRRDCFPRTVGTTEPTGPRPGTETNETGDRTVVRTCGSGPTWMEILTRSSLTPSTPRCSSGLSLVLPPPASRPGPLSRGTLDPTPGPRTHSRLEPVPITGRSVPKPFAV